MSRALLTGHGVGVRVFAGKSVQGCDQVSANALWHEISVISCLRIDCHGATVRTHGDPGHAFDTSTDGRLGLAGHDLGSGCIHGFQGRCTEAVDLFAGYALGVVSVDHCNASDIRALFAHGGYTAQDHVIKNRSVQLISIAQTLQYLCGQVHGCDRVQASALLAAAPGGADMVVDECFGHYLSPVSVAL